MTRIEIVRWVWFFACLANAAISFVKPLSKWHAVMGWSIAAVSVFLAITANQ